MFKGREPRYKNRGKRRRLKKQSISGEIKSNNLMFKLGTATAIKNSLLFVFKHVPPNLRFFFLNFLRFVLFRFISFDSIYIRFARKKGQSDAAKGSSISLASFPSLKILFHSGEKKLIDFSDIVALYVVFKLFSSVLLLM